MFYQCVRAQEAAEADSELKRWAVFLTAVGTPVPNRHFGCLSEVCGLCTLPDIGLFVLTESVPDLLGLNVETGWLSGWRGTWRMAGHVGWDGRL